METTSNLPDAIREIQRTAVNAASAKILEFEVDAGSGAKMKVPVAFLPDGDGKMKAVPMLDAMSHGATLARNQRLASADGPDKREGTANHQALESFIAHANRFKSLASAVWADASRRTLVAVLDYHPEGYNSPARWGKHRGAYQCPLSEAWLAWGGGNPLSLDQDAFAALLDGRDRELSGGKLPSGKEAPDPAALITLANNLEVYSHATAKRERDPNTGRLKISFAEEKGVSGTVLPPPSFLVLVPVFQDAPPQMLEVRLRVTVEDGHAHFAVQIHAAGEVLRDAFDELRRRVSAGTDLPVFVGTPE